MNKLTEGIAHGQAIVPNHILRLANALSGKSTNDIIIGGSLTSLGNFGVYGNTALTGSIDISSNLSLSGSLNGPGYFISKTGELFITNIRTKNINTQNLVVSSSLILKDLPQNQETRAFVSFDPSTGKLYYSTGSIEEKGENIRLSEKFKFLGTDTDDYTSFNHKIYNIKIDNTEIIDFIRIYSKPDISTLRWTKHKDIESLQTWIIRENSESSIYWIKLEVSYKPHTAGKAESILSYVK